MTFKTTLLAAAAAAGTLFAMPAAAQVSGIAVADSPVVIVTRATALSSGYRQIEQTYAAQIGQLRTLNQQLTTLQTQLDSNNDGQLTEAEVNANPGVVSQIQAAEQQVRQAQQPIALAQLYVVEQLLNEYANARTQVVQNKGIQLLLSNDAVDFAQPQANVTEDMVAALNARVPSVNAAPPAGYQPRQQTVQLHAAVQQLLGIAAQNAAARQQQQAPAAQPQGR